MDSDNNNLEKEILKISVNVARMDERTKAIQADLFSLKTDIHSKLDFVAKDTKEKYQSLEKQVSDLYDHIDDNYLRKSEVDVNSFVRRTEINPDNIVKKDEFAPIKRAFYGAMGIILVAVLTAILKIIGL